MRAAIVLIVLAAAALWLLACRTVPQPAAEAQPAPEPVVHHDSVQRGRELTHLLHSGNFDTLSQSFSSEFRQLIEKMGGFEKLNQQVRDQLGTEEEVLQEGAYRENQFTDYYRVSRFSKNPSVTTRWVWDTNGVVVGGRISPTSPATPSDYLNYQTKTMLQLPFDGEWYVAWGGREPHQNYHVIAPDQRFAYDFLVMRDGSSHRGEGKLNDDYHCFGLPVFAPADGTVVTAVDGIDDNTPGQKNPKEPPGNYIVIDHGEGEHSLLAHLRRGSVRVQNGSAVRAGDEIGQCGNSGNTTEPHLHYHLQTGRKYKEGVGLPAFFTRYAADGARVERGEPFRGQRIQKQ